METSNQSAFINPNGGRGDVISGSTQYYKFALRAAAGKKIRSVSVSCPRCLSASYSTQHVSIAFYVPKLGPSEVNRAIVGKSFTVRFSDNTEETINFTGTINKR